MKMISMLFSIGQRLIQGTSWDEAVLANGYYSDEASFRSKKYYTEV
jgi:hypothetical protein